MFVEVIFITVLTFAPASRRSETTVPCANETAAWRGAYPFKNKEQKILKIQEKLQLTVSYQLWNLKNDKDVIK